MTCFRENVLKRQLFINFSYQSMVVRVIECNRSCWKYTINQYPGCFNPQIFLNWYKTDTTKEHHYMYSFGCSMTVDENQDQGTPPFLHLPYVRGISESIELVCKPLGNLCDSMKPWGRQKSHSQRGRQKEWCTRYLVPNQRHWKNVGKKTE